MTSADDYTAAPGDSASTPAAHPRTRVGMLLGVRRLFFAMVFSACGVAAAAPGAGTPAGGSPPAAAACAGCHGPRGEGVANFPRLAGSGAVYLRSQLEAFATGARKNPVMQPIAQALTPEQRTELAAYFSQLPSPATPQERIAVSPSDVGPWLATRGRWEDAIPACAQCHGPGGIGVGESFPPLTGQSATYIAEQLTSWQRGTRPPGPLGLMERIARKLSASDIQAVSTYYEGLTSGAAVTAPATAGAGARASAPGAKP